MSASQAELLLQYLQVSIADGSYRLWEPAYHDSYFRTLIQRLRELGMDNSAIRATLAGALK